MHPLGFLGIFIALIGVFLLVWSLKGGGQAKKDIAAALAWPEATAVVVAHDVETHRQFAGRNVYSCEPKLRYRFQVGGTEYDGDRLRFGYVRTNTDHQARQLMAPYPLGSWIRIRFNPYNPAESVVELKQSTNQTWSVVVGAILIALGLGLTAAAASGALGEHRSGGHYNGRPYRPHRF
jgi:hypothetical protein